MRLTNQVNECKNGTKSNAVLALKIKLRIARPITGVSARPRSVLVIRIYCQKKTTPMPDQITLKRTCANATCLLTGLPPKEARTAVNVVPIFAPITIATDDGKSIIPVPNAANVI